MNRLIANNCSNCGARIDASPVHGRVTCQYCRETFEVVPEPAPVAPPPPRPRAVVTAPAPGAAALRGVAFSVAFTLLLGGYIAFRLNGAGAVSVPGLVATAIGGVGTAIRATQGADFMWDTVAGPPIPAEIGTADGFVGRIRMRGGSDELWIAAFDGTTLAPVWKAGPLSTYSDGYTSTFAGLAGKHVIVTDYRANVHFYDLATGHEAKVLKLTDRAKEMCTSPDRKSHVWIRVSDGTHVLVDADAGTMAPAARPVWCPDAWAASDDCRGWLKRGPPRLSCKRGDAAPKVSGFEAANVVAENGLAVALGAKHPGTAIPMAVGFDPSTRAVRWEQPIASGDAASARASSTISIMDDLVGGRFVAPYALTAAGWHFTAFDARTGARLWDVPLQPLIGVDHPEGFSLSSTRVYVMRTSSVEVYDASNGKLVGVVGAD